MWRGPSNSSSSPTEKAYFTPCQSLVNFDKRIVLDVVATWEVFRDRVISDIWPLRSSQKVPGFSQNTWLEHSAEISSLLGSYKYNYIIGLSAQKKWIEENLLLMTTTFNTSATHICWDSGPSHNFNDSELSFIVEFSSEYKIKCG